MEKLLKRIENNINFRTSIENCEKQITPILQGFITNFPEYTDHSINHSKSVLRYAEYVLNTEIEKLNEDEVYILIMAGFLHDIGMCPTNEMKQRITDSSDFKNSGSSFGNHLRDIHHKLSYEYITTFWKDLQIVNETYAEAIALVGMGHRKVDLLDFDLYNPGFVVKSGSDFVCLPYLASVLRLSDELDITNDRTPDLLYNQYFPSNPISKTEWEKHKANYFVSFAQPTIKITGKCFNKDLYYALLKHYNKIDNVVKYAQKVVATIPQNERKLKIEFFKLEKDIKTVGFAPKNIGFSFDLQNTIDTFIGENIYNDKYVAIRECLQNSIDSCRYKKQIASNSYKPEIKVVLQDRQMIISDNGLGMDEYIIENYFSKLAKSYYTEKKVSKEFESIGQFGIGVFSYFLLCDYFEVETKQEQKDSIKFKATKDADSYFYFYNESKKESVGTTIIFFLKDELTFNELSYEVNQYFRHVEIPIEIFDEKNFEIVSCQNFNIDITDILSKHIKREYIKNLENKELIEAYINDSESEGNIGLLLEKDAAGTLIPFESHDSFGTSHASVIELSQKGIFIGELNHGMINNSIGKINLKQKNNLDIGRYKIKDSNKIETTLKKHYKLIFRKIFDNWHNLSLQKRAEFTSKFLSFYLNSFYDKLKIDYFDDFLHELYYGYYDGKSLEYLNLKDILSIDEFVMANTDDPFSKKDLYDQSTIDNIYQEIKKPLVLDNRNTSSLFLINLFQSRNYFIEIQCRKKYWFYLINTKRTSSNHDFLPPRYSTLPFDSNQLCAYPGIWLERPFNSNHPIIKFYQLHREQISKHRLLSISYNDFFDEIHSLIFHFHTDTYKKNTTSEIEHINTLLKKINSIQSTNFFLSEKDFPEWMNKKINWNKLV